MEKLKTEDIYTDDGPSKPLLTPRGDFEDYVFIEEKF